LISTGTAGAIGIATLISANKLIWFAGFASLMFSMKYSAGEQKKGAPAEANAPEITGYMAEAYVG
jgi:hypothetical protein